MERLATSPVRSGAVNHVEALDAQDGVGCVQVKRKM